MQKTIYSRPASPLAKGIPAARYVACLARSNGNLAVAAANAEQYRDSPQVAIALKTAVDIGVSSDANYSALVSYGISSDLITLLRASTVLGKLSAFMRQVPFRVRVPRETVAGTFSWVGQSKPIPVSAASFDTVMLEPTKIAGIIVFTDELVKSSTPKADAAILQQMIASSRAFLDAAFLDPTVTAVSDMSPASITNGAVEISSTGASTAQITTDMISMLQARASGWVAPFFIMNCITALALISKLTTGGVRAFPDITVTGGSIFGVPVLISANIPGSPGSPSSGNAAITLIEASEILLADDENLSFDASAETSLQMLTNPATGATNVVSLFQTGCVGVKATREINFARAHDTSVIYMVVPF